MNKILLFAGTAAVLGFASCKEKGPLINFGGAKAVDTTYTTTVETQQERTMLLEEFTGCSCPPCPSGHTIIYGTGGIKEQHPDHVAVIAYHIFDFPQAEPVHGAKYDFRTDDATNVGKTIFGGIGQLPLAGIDRKLKNNVYLFDKSSWPQEVNNDAIIKPAVNVYITSTYDAATRSATVKVKLAYTQSVAKKQSLTLAIIENNIKDEQKNGLDIDTAYIHRSVLRDIITQFYGEPVMDNISTKEAGRVYERTFTFNVNAAWNADNCQLVAFVNNNEGDDKMVQQAAEVNLK